MRRHISPHPCLEHLSVVLSLELCVNNCPSLHFASSSILMSLICFGLRESCFPPVTVHANCLFRSFAVPRGGPPSSDFITPWNLSPTAITNAILPSTICSPHLFLLLDLDVSDLLWVQDDFVLSTPNERAQELIGGNRTRDDNALSFVKAFREPGRTFRRPRP